MKYDFVLLLACVCCFSTSANAEEPLRIGVIASLSGFAAQYGQAVVDGAKFGKARLRTRGVEVELFIEDDGSDMKQTVNAYYRLKAKGKLRAIIGGSWWLQAIVPLADRDKITLLSCETVHNDRTVYSQHSFILQGYLHLWVSEFDYLVKSQHLQSGVILRSTSDFGMTLGNAFRELFSTEGRKFLGELVYTDLDIQDARTLVLKLKQMRPEVVYIDGHPGSFATVLQRMRELKMNSLFIFSNAIAKEMKVQHLDDASDFPNVFYSERVAAAQEFQKEFKKAMGEEPRRNADLGTLAVELASQALDKDDLSESLKSRAYEIDGIRIEFDSKNVWKGPRIEIRRLSTEVAAAIPSSASSS